MANKSRCIPHLSPIPILKNDKSNLQLTPMLRYHNQTNTSQIHTTTPQPFLLQTMPLQITSSQKQITTDSSSSRMRRPPVQGKHRDPD